MSENYIKNVVEAALLAAGRPLQLNELAQLFEEHARPEPEALRAALAGLGADAAVFARLARNAGSDCVPAADHARRDRGSAWRCREPEHHQDGDRAQLGACRRYARRAWPTGASRHHQGFSRLLRPALAR